MTETHFVDPRMRDASEVDGRAARARVSGLVFDLDDTLMPEHRSIREALVATAAALPRSASVDPDGFAEMAWGIAMPIWEQLPVRFFTTKIGMSSTEALWCPDDYSTPALTALSRSLPAYRQKVWSTVLESLGLEIEEHIDRLGAKFIEERSRRHVPYPDAAPTLEALSGRVRLGLLTNGLPGVQRFKAKQAGLLSYFDSVVVSGDLETGKPDPILFETVLGGMGVQASHAIMVGDRIATDIAGARAAGMRTILIRRDDEARAGDAKPDWTINGLDELHDCLKAAGGLAYANRHLDGEDS